MLNHRSFLFLRKGFTFVCFCFLSFTLSIDLALATAFTWTNTSTDNNWNNSGNWNPSSNYPHVAGDTVLFDPSAPSTGRTVGNSFLFGGIEINSMTFDGSGYTFSNTNSVGDSFTLSGLGITLTPNGAGAQIINHGTLNFNNSASASASTNATTLINTFPARVNFNDMSTAGNAIITDDDEVSFNDFSKAGTAVITNRNEIFFENNSSAENSNITNTSNGWTAGKIYFEGNSSAANVYIQNGVVGDSIVTSSISFASDSTAANATIDNFTTLFFGGNATAANATIHNKGGVGLAFSDRIIFQENSNAGNAYITNKCNIYFYLSTIGGGSTPSADNATIVNTDSGVGGAVYLLGSSDFAPFSLSIGSFSDLSVGSGTLDLYETALSLGGLGNNDNIFGVISGTGSLIKLGMGALTLNGVNTYAGPTEVKAGKLIVGDVNHPLASVNSDVIVDSAATLSGFGCLGSLSNQSNGTTAPGDPSHMGTLSVNGDFTASPGSFYTAKVDGSGPDSDLLAITGAANLSGTVNIQFINGHPLPSTQYTILSAGELLEGEHFDNLVQPLCANGELIYDYTGHAVNYTLYNLSSSLAAAASTSNQTSLAYNLLALSTPPALPIRIWDRLLELTTPAELEDYLDQLSGATYANQQLALAESSNWFDEHLRDHLQQGDGKQEALSSWLVARKSVIDLSSRTVTGFKNDLDALAYGIESAKQNSLFEMGLAYTRFHGHSIEGAENSQAEGDLYQVGSYFKQNFGLCSLGAGVSAGLFSDVQAKRWVMQSIGSPAEVNSHYHASLFTAQLQAGYNGFQDGILRLQPLLGLHYQILQRAAFKEQGNSGAELNLNAAGYNSLRSQVGLATMIRPSDDFQFFAQTAFEHGYSDALSEFDAYFQEAQGAKPFHINSINLGRDMWVGKLGFSAQPNTHWNISALYEGRFASHRQENTGKVELKYSL